MIRTALYRQRENRLPAILDEKAPVSFKELSQRAAALQAVLPVQKKPAAAALLLPDGPDFLAALFAVLQAGWMAFPLNPQLTPEELSNLLRRAPVPLIFTTTELLPLCQTACQVLRPVSRNFLRRSDFASFRNVARDTSGILP